MEPTLNVLRRPVPVFLRRRFLLRFAAMAVAPLVGLGVLGSQEKLLLPLERVLVVKGKLASKGDYFEDAEVQRILMRHGIRVQITRSSSREVAVNSLGGYDFAFPSGQPAARLILDSRNAKGLRAKQFRPFVSPIVLATFREYAETLRGKGVARRQEKAGSLYYDLDMKRFLELVKGGQRWNDLGIKQHGMSNGNLVLAQTPDLCAANSAATYMGLIAFVENGNRAVGSAQEAVALARRIKPLLTEQGLPTSEIFKTYAAPEGRQIAPIIVVYEHQFLAYQLDRSDGERVLMYPQPGFFPLPELISFNDKGDRLGELIVSDSELRRRAVELGYRILDNPGAPPGKQLGAFLDERRIPAPAMTTPDLTRTVLPSVGDLEKMLVEVGCSESKPS
ncbi:hypothetical protein ACGFNU_16270 [Spirillospora sp. NPDC048911]|uniref:hypothetical protein n=1 Tax=Spirillospora sp. NPDC048911 TaxID=3364527 RepID=UPI003719EDCB